MTDPRRRRGSFDAHRASDDEHRTPATEQERRTARYLANLADRAQDAADLVHRGRESFLADRSDGRHLRRSARMLVIEISTILNERLPEAYRLARPDVPWRQIAGMRNLVNHVYDGVDDLVLWDVLVQDIPSLVRRLTDEP